MSIPWGSKHPLIIYQQGSFEETFELYNALPNGDPDFDSPINFIIGTTAKAECREKENQDSKLLAEFDIDILDNKLILKLTSEDTENIKVLSGFYDVFVTEPETEPQMFIEGKVTINKAVTVELMEP